MHPFLNQPAIGPKISPLDAALRRCGAALVVRHGRLVAAQFQSVSAEVAACLTSVGITDRSDRATFRVTGEIDAVDRALADESPMRWSSRLSGGRAIVRCELADAEACGAELGSGGASVLDCSDEYAGIGVIGPAADRLLGSVPLGVPAVVVWEADECFEVLVAAEDGPRVWDRLLMAGEPLDIACVGHDALDQLAASHRLGEHRRPA